MSTWNLFSPRLGVTMKLSADGRTILRSSYGRFTQGVLTGELSPFHPGVTPTTTTGFDPTTGGYARPISVVDPKINLQLRPRHARAPDGQGTRWAWTTRLGRRLAVAAAYVRKAGANFIGWTDVGRPVSRRHADSARWSQPAGIRARQRHGRPSLSLDESRRLLDDVQLL